MPGEDHPYFADLFAPCLQDKCAMCRTSDVIVKHLTSTGATSAEYQFMFYCGLAGKP